MTRRTLICIFAMLLSSVALCIASNIDSELESTLTAAGPREEIPVIATLIPQVNLQTIKKNPPSKVIQILKSHAAATQTAIVAHLERRGARKLIRLWAINGIAFTARSDVIRELEGSPQIKSIRLDKSVSIPPTSMGIRDMPEWNLRAIHAPDLWNKGYRGEGVVIATMDTGADANHPDLKPKWRGGGNSWYDPNDEHNTPYDANGHGTQSLGIIVGGAVGGSSIGVAPNAKWIAVKIFNDSGTTTYSIIHQGFQWLLDPDHDAITDDAPHVVNNSWILDNVNDCSTEFESDLQLLRSIDIAVVFSGGNYGPNSATSVSPANNIESFAIGATDASNTVAYFSSRGVSACDGSIYPEIVAPGANIRTSDLTLGGLIPDSYIHVSGTSFAAPHVAGAMALLLNAFPGLKLQDLEEALKTSALDLANPGADNDSGYGLIDALAAYNKLNSSIGSDPVAYDDTYAVAEDTTLTVDAPGVLANDFDPNNDPLIVNVFDPPLYGTLSLDPTGAFTYSPSLNFNGTDSFTYTANDGSVDSSPATVTITVNPMNDPPVAVNDNVDTTKNVAVTINVTSNDYDLDGAILPGTTEVLTSPANGKLTNNGDGTITYKPKKKFKGTDNFSYIVSDDAALISNIATVTITIHKRNR